MTIPKRSSGSFRVKSRCKIFWVIFKTLEDENVESKYNFGTDEKVSINYGEQTYDESPETRENVRAKQLANGTKDIIDFMMEDDPDLSEEEAILLFQKKRDRTRALTGLERLNTLLAVDENVSE